MIYRADGVNARNCPLCGYPSRVFYACAGCPSQDKGRRLKRRHYHIWCRVCKRSNPTLPNGAYYYVPHNGMGQDG